MKRDAMIVFRLPSDVLERLDVAAEREQRSRSNMALRIITEWLDERGIEATKPGRARKSTKRG